MGGAKGKIRTALAASIPQIITRIEDLTPDPCNVNKGTERGLGMLERSLQKYGAGRSILTDKHGIVLAGNKTLDRAAELGLKIQVVKTRGDRLVVVQREDLEASDPRARELALADNRVAEVDLEWDAEALKALQDGGVDLGEFWQDSELASLLSRAEGDGTITTDDVTPTDYRCPRCGCEWSGSPKPKKGGDAGFE